MSELRMTPDDIYRFIDTEFPQIKHFGMKIERLDVNRLRLRVPVDHSHLRPGGTVSGPTMMTLVDAGLYLLILARLGPVALAVTTNLNINFLRKPAPTDLLAEAQLLKLGKQLAVGEVTLYSQGNEVDPVAHATLTYSIPPARG